MVAIPVRENPVTTRMYEAAARNDKPGRNYLGMSGIGGPCERALWYDFRGYTPSCVDGRAKMIFSLGDRVEEEVVKWLELAGYAVTERQRAFVALNGFFRGHWDGRIEGVTRRPHVLEIKSANSRRFAKFKTEGVRAVSPAYYCQVQCYMAYSGLERALFVIMCKDTCELYTERVYFNRPDFEMLEERARRVICCNDPINLNGVEENCERCAFRFRCQPENPHIQARKTCGTCFHCHAGEDCTMHCVTRHYVEIKNWGLSCPDWCYADTLDRVPF